MSASTSSAIARRREELYGMTRLKNAEALKSNLTTDHIEMISKEGLQDDKPSWQSTAKMNYKGTQPLRGGNQFVVSEKQRAYQDTSHFDFRGDAAPIDDGIYLASLTSEDYQHKKIQPLPPVKPDGNVNLPDMNPRYWKDKSMGESLYATDFSDNKEVRLGVELPDVVNERNDMRKRNVEDVRNTHFHFGNDPLSFNTETGLCYNAKRPLPAVGVGKKPGEKDSMTAAELTQKMLEQERDSAIFREGDYNVTYPKPQVTTFSRDFDARAKPYKSAAFVEPTRTQKGRFLLDSPMKRYVEKEAALYPGPHAGEETTRTDTITDSSALRHLFLQYDPSRSGYVNVPLVRRVCDSLLHPIPSADIETTLNDCSKGRNGAIKYDSFINHLFELQKSRHPDQKIGVNAEEMETSAPSTEENVRPFYEPKESSLDEPILGKEYQTSVHFKFGNDNDKLSSIYNKDFQKSQKQQSGEKKIPPPQPSEVMHKIPGVGFGDSTKQVDYVNFKEVSPAVFQDSMAARDKASLKNKRRHEINSVVLAGDKEKEAADRQKSLSHASYTRHRTSNHSRSLTAPPSKYNYLDSDGALPYPSNAPQLSETNEAFAGGQNLAIESSEALDAFKNENKERSKDGKRAHFHLGNDDLNHTSEAMDNFKTHAPVTIEAAGKKNQDDPRFPHHRVSQNTQDLSRDPMAPSNFQAQRMVKKSYYNAIPNPKDPLHIKLRGRFMDVDREKTGRLDKRTVKNISKEFHISISENAMDNLLQRCESDFGDETVDYHKFVRSLTLEEVPNDVSAAHSHSVMMRDYRPLDQRSFTNAQLLTMSQMEKKPVEPMVTHFFHVDGSGENHFESLTTQDYVKPELQA